MFVSGGMRNVDEGKNRLTGRSYHYFIVFSASDPMALAHSITISHVLCHKMDDKSALD